MGDKDEFRGHPVDLEKAKTEMSLEKIEETIRFVYQMRLANGLVTNGFLILYDGKV